MPLNPKLCVLRTCTDCILGLVSVTHAPKHFILITKPQAKLKCLPDPHLVPRVCHLPPTLKRNNHLKNGTRKLVYSSIPHVRPMRARRGVRYRYHFTLGPLRRSPGEDLESRSPLTFELLDVNPKVIWGTIF